MSIPKIPSKLVYLPDEWIYVTEEVAQDLAKKRDQRRREAEKINTATLSFLLQQQTQETLPTLQAPETAPRRLVYYVTEEEARELDQRRNQQRREAEKLDTEMWNALSEGMSDEEKTEFFGSPNWRTKYPEQ